MVPTSFKILPRGSANQKAAGRRPSRFYGRLWWSEIIDIFFKKRTPKNPNNFLRASDPYFLPKMSENTHEAHLRRNTQNSVWHKLKPRNMQVMNCQSFYLCLFFGCMIALSYLIGGAKKLKIRLFLQCFFTLGHAPDSQNRWRKCLSDFRFLRQSFWLRRSFPCSISIWPLLWMAQRWFQTSPDEKTKTKIQNQNQN